MPTSNHLEPPPSDHENHHRSVRSHAVNESRNASRRRKQRCGEPLRSTPNWISSSGRIRSSVSIHQGLSKDELIRKLMLGKMQRAEYANGRDKEIRAWVEEELAPKFTKRRYDAKSRVFSSRLYYCLFNVSAKQPINANFHRAVIDILSPALRVERQYGSNARLFDEVWFTVYLKSSRSDFESRECVFVTPAILNAAFAVERLSYHANKQVPYPPKCFGASFNIK